MDEVGTNAIKTRTTKSIRRETRTELHNPLREAKTVLKKEQHSTGTFQIHLSTVVVTVLAAGLLLELRISNLCGETIKSEWKKLNNLSVRLASTSDVVSVSESPNLTLELRNDSSMPMNVERLNPLNDEVNFIDTKGAPIVSENQIDIHFPAIRQRNVADFILIQPGQCVSVSIPATIDEIPGFDGARIGVFETYYYKILVGSVRLSATLRMNINSSEITDLKDFNSYLWSGTISTDSIQWKIVPKRTWRLLIANLIVGLGLLSAVALSVELLVRYAPYAKKYRFTFKPLLTICIGIGLAAMSFIDSNYSILQSEDDTRIEPTRYAPSR